MREFIKGNASGPSGGAATDRFIFTAASAIDPATMRRVPEAATIADELRVVLGRIEETLAEDGMTLRDLTKVTAWVSEEQHRLEFAYAYAEQLSPGPYPSRALFQIGLPGGCRIQIDAIASRRAPALAQNESPIFLSGGSHETESGFAAGAQVGGLVWVEASAVDATGRRMPEVTNVAEETLVCLERLRETLNDAGCDLSDLVKVNCYLASDNDRAEFWQTFDEALAPGPYPVRVTQVGGVAGDARVLLDAVAAR